MRLPLVRSSLLGQPLLAHPAQVLAAPVSRPSQSRYEQGRDDRAEETTNQKHGHYARGAISILQPCRHSVCTVVHSLPGRFSGPVERRVCDDGSVMPVKRVPTGPPHPFDLHAFLESAGVSRRIVRFGRGAQVFAQGAQANSVFYLQRGGVKLSVLSLAGKEAVVALLEPGDFFGEGCLAGQTLRMGTAAAVVPTTVLRIPKLEMIRTLHEQPAFSDRFIAHMLARNIRIEEDLVDQLFNSSEKRLARTLLLLARYGKEDAPQRVLPMLSQETLAEMVGTTRSRVNFFMNKFRKLGFIDYNGGLKIHSSLLSVVLHD
jgi:CRP/FNR family cyclic AMP-dependent transcriptional regulator